MNRKPVTIVSAAVIILVCGSLNLKAQSSPQSAAAPKKAEDQFKNIQVLKGTSADQIFPTMQFIAASLGVECDFCHVQNAFEKDDKKPKQTARKMMEMMFAINKDNFQGNRQVTCYSCHRGSAHPMAIPAVLGEDTKEPMGAAHRADEEKNPGEASKEAATPSPDQLLDKYVQALGGATAVDKVNSRIMKGTIDFGGKSFPIDIYAKDPEKRISFTHTPEGDSVTAFNGSEGWLGSPGRPLREMHGSDLDSAAIDADLHLATHLKGMFTDIKTQGSDKIGDREKYIVVGRREGKTPIELYFDADSGLLVRLVRYGETALGWMPTQIDYANYRDVDGVKTPFRWTLARPNGRFTIQIDEMEQNVPVDDSKFAKPQAPEPESKAQAR
jgi:photosynthetic reaction center cytochrome c subunit